MKIVEKFRNWYQKNQKLLTIICTVILALIPFLHVNSGVEFTDTGYSLGNYANFANANGTWALATFFANVTGWLFTKLPFGGTMLGMSFYCNAILSGLSILSFLYLRKYLPLHQLFAGELLAVALSWCPRVILYNYLTYFLFTVGCILLYEAIRNEKRRLYFLAGIVLGLNLFVRFPNIVECILILVVIYAGLLKKEKATKVLQNIGLCVGGYMAAAAIVFIVIGCIYGFSEYFKMIQSLFAMKETANSYSAVTMVKDILRAYWEQLRWYFLFIGACFVATESYRFLKMAAAKYICSGLYLASILGITLFLYKKVVFWRNYNELHAVKFWVVGFILISIGIAIYTMISKKTKWEEKISASIVLTLIFVTPLGSNNALYPVYNNLFLIAPFTFYAGWKIFGRKKDILWPTQLFLAVFICILFFQSLMFGWVYTFRDSGFTTGINTTITQNDVYKGMRTTKERTEQIEELTKFVYDNEYCGQEVLLFGEIPFASYALSMPSALSSSWADLNTVLNVDEMEAEMNALKEPPVVIIASDQYQDLLNDPQTENEKALLISKYLNDFGYVELFRNEKFVLYDIEKE